MAGQFVNGNPPSRGLAMLFVLVSAIPVSAQDEGYEELQGAAITALSERRIDEAVELLERCLLARPEDAASAYNLACASARQARPDEAFPWLERALVWGFRDGGLLHTDADLSSLFGDKRWVAIQEHSPGYALCHEC
ncbi:MAG: thioredoxin-like negative regulator of GroEL [Candidatus Paceibacteria bacterium]|jgi:thioredoxin-like negative regulator of GroEL